MSWGRPDTDLISETREREFLAKMGSDMLYRATWTLFWRSRRRGESVGGAADRILNGAR